jgi:hypothetical protein
MPPKAAPVVTPVGKKISVTVKVSKPADFEDGIEQAPTKGLRMRAFTIWPDTPSAITTPMFGEKDGPFAWKDESTTSSSRSPSQANSPTKPSNEDETATGDSNSSRSSRLVSTMQYSFAREIKDNDAIRAFHEESGIYFTFQYVDTTSLKIVNLFYIDLSCFLVDCHQPIQLHRKVYEKYEVDITIAMEETFQTWNDLLLLNPVMLRLKR